jgi:hypothetical protein
LRWICIWNGLECGRCRAVRDPRRERVGRLDRPPSRPRFGDLLVRRGLASSSQVTSALRVQAERAAAGQHPNLGEILVEQGVLRPEQVRAVLADLDQIILYCPACAERFNVPAARRGSAACPVDGTPLVAAQEGAPLGVAAPTPTPSSAAAASSSSSARGA